MSLNGSEDGASGQLLHTLFEAQVARSPENIAVVFGDEKLTYAELDQRAGRLARRLHMLGVARQALVAIYLERSVDMVVALLAVLKAGGAYVPLDPSFPRERVAFMIEDAQIAAVVTQRALCEKLPAKNASLIVIEDDADAPAFTMPVYAEDLAYVIYTSGSTGRPKGVEIPHRAVVNFLRSMLQKPGMSASDVVLAVTTISFDIAALEIFLPLICGARVVIASRQTAMDAALLIQELTRNGVTVLQATPATWRMLLAAGWTGDARLKMLIGGEAVQRDLANALAGKGAALWNMYGPTETTIWSSVHLLKAGYESVSIGRPIDRTQMHILDENLRPVAPGEEGELLIGGDGLARGYLNRPELTAEKFIDSPFTSGARLYKTGDLARWLPDGTIECLGRIDHQVKVRGFRIELGEIECSLREHPNLQDAAVIADDSRLIAYIVASPLPAATALRAFLKQRLPAYMIPAAFVPLPALPLTANGKLDRRALPAAATVVTTAAVTEPVDDHQRQMRKIWERILRVSPIGIDDDFFELGGHSLFAVELVASVEKTLNQKLPLAKFFNAPTIRQLCALLSAQTPNQPWCVLEPLRTEGDETPFFCIADYFDIVEHFPPGQPFYGINLQSLVEWNGGMRSIVAMAELCQEAIRAVQPHGPYLLGGHSFGGIIAAELAVQFLEKDEPVALLALIEPDLPSSETSENFTMRTHRKLFEQRKHLSNIWQDIVNYPAEERWHYAVRRLQRRVALQWRRRFDPALRAALRERDELESHYVAPPHHRPRFFKGTAALFLARDTHHRPGASDPRRAWSQHAAHLDVLDVPGDHLGVVREPHARAVAASLRACFQKALAQLAVVLCVCDVLADAPF